MSTRHQATHSGAAGGREIQLRDSETQISQIEIEESIKMNQQFNNAADDRVRVRGGAAVRCAHVLRLLLVIMVCVLGTTYLSGVRAFVFFLLTAGAAPDFPFPFLFFF